MKKYLFLLIVLLLYSCEKPYTQTGEASYYSNYLQGKGTSSGDKYHKDSLTAAHMYLPLGTEVEVTNLSNDESVVVTINDRGPYVEGRIIDLSRKAAEELGFIDEGTTKVKIEVVEPAEGYTRKDSIAEDRIIRNQ